MCFYRRSCSIPGVEHAWRHFFQMSAMMEHWEGRNVASSWLLGGQPLWGPNGPKTLRQRPNSHSYTITWLDTGQGWMLSPWRRLCKTGNTVHMWKADALKHLNCVHSGIGSPRRCTFVAVKPRDEEIMTFSFRICCTNSKVWPPIVVPEGARVECSPDAPVQHKQWTRF